MGGGQAAVQAGTLTSHEWLSPAVRVRTKAAKDQFCMRLGMRRLRKYASWPTFSSKVGGFDSRRLHSSKSLPESGLEKLDSGLASNGHQSGDPGWLALLPAVASEYGPALRYLVEAWPHLPPHIRAAIFTLVDSVAPPFDTEGGQP